MKTAHAFNRWLNALAVCSLLRHVAGKLRLADKPREDLGLKGFQAGLVNPDEVMHKELAYDWPYVINPDRCATGYLYVTCLNDVQDSQKRWYSEEVKREDQVPMTIDVCYDFCHKIPGTQYFGLQNGDRCFCTPFFISGMPFFHDGRHESQAKWTGKGHFKGMCDMPCVGEPGKICGGKELSDIYQLVDCSPATPTTTTTTNACGFSHPTEIRMENSHLVTNNLGGAGPDTDSPKELRFTGVATIDGANVDLVVQSMSTYQPGVAEGNGVFGEFGRINVKEGSSVDLKFSFVDGKSGQPVVLPAFYLSIFDIDQSERGDQTESVTVDVGGMDQYVTDSMSEVLVAPGAQGKVVFTSTRHGAPCDDPKDPWEFSEVKCDGSRVDQRLRAVTMHFSNVATVSLSPSVSCTGEECFGYRSLIFAGSSGLVDGC
mmetsp:Transcript_8955/g.16119  ORF Transcript_8955/g.16119 Transcript_8955/m.16119 type:complete len:430 (+) Transcript_8955:56-1345(+)